MPVDKLQRQSSENGNLRVLYQGSGQHLLIISEVILFRTSGFLPVTYSAPSHHVEGQGLETGKSPYYYPPCLSKTAAYSSLLLPVAGDEVLLSFRSNQTSYNILPHPDTLVKKDSI